MSSKDHIAIPMIAVLVVVAVASGVAGATTTEEGLSVGVTQDGSDVAVTVTQNGTVVENASVAVEALDNGSYAGEGSYATDANGTVSLPAPAENQTVEITAAKGNHTATITAPLVGVADELSVAVDQSGADVAVTVADGDGAVENASVTVTALENGSYAGEGSYATDANGTVGLPAPERNVTVEVTVEAGNATGSTTADLVAVEDDPEFENFGQRVSWFVHSLLGDDDREGGIGDAVSEFVKSNNPGNDNRPEHAGPPEDAGDHENESSGGGPPEHANDDKEKNNGNGNGNGKK